VVTLSDGQNALLDTSNGTTSPLSKGEILWCQSDPNYKVNVPSGDSYEAERTSTPLFYGCTANGRASEKEPVTTPDSVGFDVDGTFVWPAPGGLHERVVGLQQSIA
jgi:hypothetical protein